MTVKLTFSLIILLFLGNYSSVFSQKRPSNGRNNKKPLHDIASDHKQIYNSSCIPMSIEMVLKYNNRVPYNFYDLQNNWKDKMDGTFADFDGKTIAGLKFKHQFNIKRGDNFPFTSLFKTIDNELAAGRKVIISLPSGFNYWHMYVIDRKIDQDDYLSYSRSFNNNTLITLEYVKRWIFSSKGTDILTYSIIN